MEANNLVCTKCKAPILEKNDVAALDNEIVHQSCKNEWLKFQNTPKVSFVTQTFENRSIESIINELDVQQEEIENNPAIRMEVTYAASHNFNINNTFLISVGEQIFSAKLIQKTANVLNNSVNLYFERVQEREPELRTFFQRFELTYPDDFVNRTRQLTFSRTNLIKQLKTNFVSQDLESIEYRLYNTEPSLFRYWAFISRDDESIRPFIPPLLISNQVNLQIMSPQELKPFGLFLLFELFE